MLRKPNHIIAVAWLLIASFMAAGMPAFAALPAAEEVLNVMGMDMEQIAGLAQGKPVTYALPESSDTDLAMGIALYLPVPVAMMSKYLQQENPDPLDIDVAAYGLLTERGGTASLASVALPTEEIEDLLNAEPGSKFNLSAAEIDSFTTLKHKASTENTVLQHYREILFRRFKAYRHGGTAAITPYLRNDGMESKPSLELRQAANASAVLSRYFPALHKAWLNYPQPLPPEADESFPWVEKKVESRPAVILRHRISIDWNGGLLVLTREFYAPHSYNSSQWLTGCLAYRDGTVVFKLVHSYTDQVAGIASDIKHVIGRELLKDKLLKSFTRLCDISGQCP